MSDRFRKFLYVCSPILVLLFVAQTYIPSGGLFIIDSDGDTVASITDTGVVTAVSFNGSGAGLTDISGDGLTSEFIEELDPATPASGDLFVAVDATDGDLKQYDAADILGAGGGITDGDTLSTGLTFPNTGLEILDTNASHSLILRNNFDMTADRTLNIIIGDANRTFTLTGDASLEGTNTGDQDLSSLTAGAASSTDNALARFDSTTGKVLQNSSATLDDSGNLTATAFFGDGSGLTGVSGSGDVSKVGTPLDGQIGVWTGDGTIEGDAAFTFGTADDTLTIAASGNFNFGAVNILDDSSGTTTLNNIDAIDATTQATIEAAIGSGTGDVTGPGSSTDNSVPRFDSTTGKVLQESGIIVDDSNNITGVGTVDGRDIADDGTKLDGIEAGADDNPSDAEIVTSYNNEVPAASQVEMEAGTETAIRRMTPERVAQAIAALETNNPVYGNHASAGDDSVYVDADGDVGIGTVSPSVTGVHVYSTTAAPRLLTQYFNEGSIDNSVELAGTATGTDGPGTAGWTNPGNVTANDATNTTVEFSGSEITAYLKATNFGFDIPTGATVLGVVATIENTYTPDSTPNGYDENVYIVLGGSTQTAGTNKASLTIWPTSSLTVRNYGGSSDTWDETLNESVVENSGFGVAFSFSGDDLDAFSVDYISITVYYSTGAAGDYEYSSGINLASGSWSLEDDTAPFFQATPDVFGVGATAPMSPWASGRNAMEFGPALAISGQATGADIFFNAYDSSDGSPEYSYTDDGAAGRIRLTSDGDYEYYTAASGTADGVITWVKRLTVGDGLTYHAVGGTDFEIAGDGTVTGDISATPGDGTVTNAKLANMVESTIKGRAASAGTGAPVDLTATQVRTIINVEDGAEANDVDSVNSQTGAVVLDADDIDDTSTTNKFVTASDVTNLGNLSGTNTGDQDLSSLTTGAASSTDNALVRFDSTTGKVVQNGTVTEDDSGNLAGVGTINTHTIPGGTSTLVTETTSQTLTNKVVLPVESTDSSGPFTVDLSSRITQLVITLSTSPTTVSNPTNGPPANGYTLLYMIDKVGSTANDGITWDTDFVAGEEFGGVIPDLSTTDDSWGYYLWIWNNAESEWHLLASNQGN